MSDEQSLADRVEHLEIEIVRLTKELKATNEMWVWAVNTVERKLIEKLERAVDR